MSRSKFIQLVLAIFTIVTCLNVAKAQSTEFTYQGRLLFGDAPATGSYDFEFALFDAATGGNQLGATFPLSAVNVNNGVFSVRVDFGNQFPGSPRFLEIHVRQTGSSVFAVLSPRQAISSAPYAIKSLNAVNSDNATNANQLGGVTANQFVVTGDTRLSDARNPLPSSAFYIQNATSQQALSNFNISGTGTANIFNAASQYNIGGRAVLSMPGTQNLFGGQGSGLANTTGTFNTFFGTAAGNVNTSGISNSLFGNLAGVANTTGSFNSFFGDGAGSSNTTANSNSFFGGGSGAKTTTGAGNSFFGAGSGSSNTTGTANAFFGGNGIANTTGFSNTFIGVGAGNGNTTGADNSFVGAGAGANNTTGINNTAVGTLANFGSGDLSFATAIGAGAMVSTSNTVVLGRTADAVLIPGSLNVTGPLNANLPPGNGNYIQNTTTQQTASNFNVSGSGTVGGTLTAATSVRSPIFVDSSNSNFFVDPASSSTLNVLRFNTIDCINGFCPPNNAVRMTPNFHLNSGAGNAVIVNWDNGTTSTNATFRVGNGQGAEVLRILADGSIGIGTTTPAEKLDIATNSGHVLLGNAGCNAGFTGIGFGTSLSGCPNFSLVGNGTDTIINRPVGGVIHFREGNSTQLAIASGGFVGIGTASPTASLTVFNPNTARFDLLTSSSGNPSFGYSQSVRADGLWQLSTSAGSSRIAVDSNGFVAIGGTPTAAARLFVNGDLRAFGSINVGNLFPSGNQSVCLNGGYLATCSSSIRYKTDVQSFTQGLDLIRRLRPVSFMWKSDHMPDMGLVAEDVAKVEPLLVTHNEKGEVEGVKYDRVGVVLVNAVNEQQAEIESLRKLVAVQTDALKQQQALARKQQAEIDALKQAVRSRRRATAVRRARS